jgi:uncharacterized protein YggU (UPF0235/DUF167 family)
LLRVLARELGVPRTSLRVVIGATARSKVVEVPDAAAEAIRSRWPGLVV